MEWVVIGVELAVLLITYSIGYLTGKRVGFDNGKTYSVVEEMKRVKNDLS